MPSDNEIKLRFNELRQHAKRGALTPEQRAEYDEVAERFARTICAAQNIPLKPGQRARSSFRVAVLFKVEFIVAGSIQKTATMDISEGGFSLLLGISAPPGTEVSFKMLLSSKDTLSGIAVVVGAEKERTGNLYRISFAFRELEDAAAARLKEALFDAVLLGNAPVLPMSTPAGGTAARPSGTEVKRTSSGFTSATEPKASNEPRERAKSISELLLEEAIAQIRGASDPALHEQAPISGAAPPSPPSPPRGEARKAPAKDHDRASEAPRSTPLGMVAAAPLPPPSPARRVRSISRSRALIAGVAVVGSMIVTGLASRLAYTSSDVRVANAMMAPIAASVAATEAPRPAAANATAPPPRSAIASASPAESPRTAPASKEGKIRVTATGHRVFIDGRVVGEGPRTVPVACGAHQVRIGSAGVSRPIDVPCGGEIAVGNH